MQVAPAEPADVDAIAGVEARAAHGPWSAAAVRATLAAPTTRAWVVRDPRVVGHLLTSHVLDEAEILTLAVDPSRRRQGLARQLLAAAEAAWRAVGVARIHLEVRADNAPARALYTACGWAEVGRRPAYYRDGEAAILMRRTLSSA